jgi:hypothetical protein
MPQKSLMERVLADQWKDLPAALRRHYRWESNTDRGNLNIDYPVPMQLLLNGLRLMAVLINQRGSKIPVQVHKWMDADVQHWERRICFPGRKPLIFKSHWVREGENTLTEYVNSFLGLKMRVYVEDGNLHYQGICHVLKIGKQRFSIPEWLLLGHTSIIEKALDDDHFSMDFRLQHPWFGQVYRYWGKFSTRQ